MMHQVEGGIPPVVDVMAAEIVFVSDASCQENHQGERGPAVRYEDQVHEGGDPEVLH